MTRKEVESIGEGIAIENLVNTEFYGQARSRAWSRIDADALVLMLDMVSRLPEQDFHLEHRGDNWSVCCCFVESGINDWVDAPSFRLAICRAALIMTLKQEEPPK